MKVDVYRNLRDKVWSVRAREGPEKGRVVKHAHYLTLLDCEFVVQEAGRERVRQEGQKNVHAFVRGTLVPRAESTMSDYPIQDYVEVTYDPYQYENFVYKQSDPLDPEKHMEVYAASRVVFLPDQVFATGVEDEWDRQIQRDLENGRLDPLLAEVEDRYYAL